MSHWRFAIAALGVIITAACSAATRGSGAARCAPQEIDSSWTVGGPVYRACEVDRAARWENTYTRPPDYTPTRGCETAVLDFVVDERGVVDLTTVRTQRSNSLELVEALVASLGRFRYRPAMKNGVPVRQVVRLPIAVAMTRVMVGLPGPPAATVRSACIP